MRLMEIKMTYYLTIAHDTGTQGLEVDKTEKRIHTFPENDRSRFAEPDCRVWASIANSGARARNGGRSSGWSAQHSCISSSSTAGISGGADNSVRL